MPERKKQRRKEGLARGKSGIRERPFTVVDLFSGCGGMSLGFLRAGFQIAAGLDHDVAAARTFAANFGKLSSARRTGLSVLTHDIERVSPREFARMALGKDECEGAIDVLIGGPPCQAFAKIGRAKLRETMNHDHAYLHDHRANLYTHLLWYAEVFRPKAVLLENVPDIMNFGGKNVAEEIAVSLEALGFRARYTVLNSAHYGVPQMRPRMFLMAIRNDLGVEPRFPTPTKSIRLPRGYWIASKAAPGQLRLFDDGLHYVEPPMASEDLPAAVTALQALGELPKIKAHLHGSTNGARSPATPFHYPTQSPRSDYEREMRRWPLFKSGAGLSDHITRCLPRDHRIFRRMAPGDDFPRAMQVARRLFAIELARRERRAGRAIREGTTEYEELVSAYVPPYREDAFPDKWRKLYPDRPSHTLTAHLGKDTYSHIHYDSAQARVISVREAARLQSFPDGYTFFGGMNAAYRQIGNAVPPLQAFALAKEIRKLLLGAATLPQRRSHEP